MDAAPKREVADREGFRQRRSRAMRESKPALERFAVALLGLLLAAVASLPDVAQAAIYSWTGATGASWSNAGNWSPVGIPANGDALLFPAGASNPSNTNDLPAGTSLVGISLLGDGYTLGGNGIVLTTNLSNSGAGNVINVPIDVQANPVTIGNSGELTIAGSLSGTGPIAMSGVGGWVTLAGAGGYTGTITAALATHVHLHGTSLPAATFVTGSLSGNGTVGPLTNNVFLSPGQAPQRWAGNGVGLLATANLSLAIGEVSMDIEGAVAGSGYDQIRVTGTVTLTSPSLRVAMGQAFVPAVGQQFVLIDNDGADAVVGTFWGMPEGTAVTLNGARFVISYVGGDGNDVVLTCVLAPKRWTGASSAFWSDANNWTPPGVPVAGDALAFPQGAANVSTTNDLPAATSFTGISLLGNGYRVGGNGIVLTTFLSNSGSSNVLNLPVDVQANALEISHSDSFTIAGSLEGSGPITTSGTGGAVVLKGSGGYSGTITAAPSYCCGSGVVLDGASLPSASVTNAFSLSGNGTIGALNVVGAGDLSPGGRISAGNLALSNGKLWMDIDGAAAGSRYDQLRVTGTVSLGTTTPLDVRLSPSYAPANGQQFVLIDNDGVDAVTGMFNGKPEGSVITLNGVHQFALSYSGGDGNDVTLTPINGLPGTVTTVASSANPSSVGQPVTFTATVAGSGTTPTGKVTFRDGLTVLVTATLDGGSASFKTSLLSVGSHAIAVDYDGDAGNGGGTSGILTQVVNGNSAYLAGLGLSGGVQLTPFFSGDTTSYTASVTYAVGSIGVRPFLADATATVTVNGTPVASGSLSSPIALSVGANPIDVVVTAQDGTTTKTYTVTVTRAPSAVSGSNPNGAGTIIATIAGGTGCAFSAGEFIPLTGHPSSPPAGSAPAGATFPYGLFDFTVSGCAIGGTVAVQVVYPDVLPSGTRYWKYGPTTDRPTPHWYVLPSTVVGNTVSFSITDGGPGDDDLTANGTVVDQGGPGVMAVVVPMSATPVPTLSQWATLLLSLAMLGAGSALARRRRARA